MTPDQWPDKMTTTIVQPNAVGEPVREHAYTAAEVGSYLEMLIEAARATDDPNAPRVPSDEACNWCRARGDCEERTAMALNTARTVFAPLMLGDDLDDGMETAKIPGLAPETLRLIMESKPFITTVFKDVEDHIYGELEAGREVPGYKLIEGRMAQSWNLPAEDLVERFKNTSTTSKISYPDSFLHNFKFFFC